MPSAHKEAFLFLIIALCTIGHLGAVQPPPSKETVDFSVIPWASRMLSLASLQRAPTVRVVNCNCPSVPLTSPGIGDTETCPGAPDAHKDLHILPPRFLVSPPVAVLPAKLSAQLLLRSTREAFAQPDP